MSLVTSAAGKGKVGGVLSLEGLVVVPALT